MAKLKAKKRARMKPKSFGLPSKAKTAKARKRSGNYPMPDRAHAANAKARSTQQYRKGRLSKSQRDRIHAKANRILGKGKKRSTRKKGRSRKRSRSRRR